MSASRGGILGEVMRPPNQAGDAIITATSVTGSAANLDLGAANVGKWITMQAVGGDVYVRFKSSANTANVATTTGLKIVDGTKEHFFTTTESRHVEHIGSTTCTLRWWRSSSP